MESIGDRLKHYAAIRCGTLKQLAEELGMAPANLSKYSTGRHQPGAKLLRMLANHGCNVHWLLIGEGSMLAEDAKGEETRGEDQKMITVLGAAGITDAEKLKAVLVDLQNIMGAHDRLTKSLSKNVRKTHEPKH